MDGLRWMALNGWLACLSVKAAPVVKSQLDSKALREKMAPRFRWPGSFPLPILNGLSGLWLVVLLLGACEMSLADELFAGFPQQITAGASKAVVYEQQPGYFALHGEPLPADRALAVFEPEAMALLRGSPAGPLAPEQRISPVYGPKGGGALACPTGQLFIRFADGDTVEAHRSELEQAGFRITAVLDHAPQAAWLRARSGSIAEALAGVSQLETMAGVDHVEPQLLMQRSHR